MKGRAFLEVARELVQGGTEAHWRSAAGRAYYTIMLECRETLRRWGFIIPGGPGIHNFLRLRLSQTTDADLKRLGNALDRLSQLRNYADYELPASPSFQNSSKANDAIVRATDALTLLDAIERDPARRANATAAIQAAWP
jgi:hypothetical protein